MKPFKAAFAEASAKWMQVNPGVKRTDYDISGLVSSAFTKATQLEILQSGFKCRGNFPLDRNIFSDLFTTATLTRICLNSNSDTKFAITDVLRVLSLISNVYQNRINTRSTKTQRSEILTFSLYANNLFLKM